jgi:hypothetical protein
MVSQQKGINYQVSQFPYLSISTTNAVMLKLDTYPRKVTSKRIEILTHGQIVILFIQQRHEFFVANKFLEYGNCFIPLIVLKFLVKFLCSG